MCALNALRDSKRVCSILICIQACMKRQPMLVFVGSARIRSSAERRAEAVSVRVLAKAKTTSLLPPAWVDIK